MTVKQRRSGGDHNVPFTAELDRNDSTKTRFGRNKLGYAIALALFGLTMYMSDLRSWKIETNPVINGGSNVPIVDLKSVRGVGDTNKVNTIRKLDKSIKLHEHKSTSDSAKESVIKPSITTPSTSKSSTDATSVKASPGLKSRPIADNRFEKRTLNDYHDLCVVGAGLSGSVIAERHANIRNQTSLIIERRDHIGGNCYDFIDDETGIRVSKYGAHLFHTNYERVWDYVQKFSDWTKYEHEVVALIDGKHVPVPVNINTVNSLFGLKINDEKEMDEWLKKEQVAFENPKNSEEMALSRVGQRLYELIFHPYTIKQWAKEPKELGPEVTARIPVRNNRDGRYFADPHQALPTKGYTAIFEKMMDNPLITVKTSTDFFEVRDSLKCGKIIYTGPIDRYFADLGWNKLEYRSLDFQREVVKNIDFFQPKGVVNHPNATTNYTRIVEYKHFLNQASADTILFYEYSKDDGEPYYPVPNPENENLFKKYKDMAAKEHGVTFAGRLANYKYFNMDQTIENALSLFDEDNQSMDLVVGYCEGDDITWIKDWHEKIKFNQVFVYASCTNPPPSEQTTQVAKSFTRALNPKFVEDKEEGTSSQTIMFDKASKLMLDAVKADVDHGSADPIAHHFLRNDIDFGSQTVVVQGNTKMKVDIVMSSLTNIQKESVFIDFALLPFLDCKASKCDRNLNRNAGMEYLVTHEALKRYVGVNHEELKKQALI